MTATVDRLGAANQARRDGRTERLAHELVSRLRDMPAPMLAALWACVGAEVERRAGAR